MVALALPPWPLVEAGSNALSNNTLPLPAIFEAAGAVRSALRLTIYGVASVQVTETGDPPAVALFPKAVTGVEAWQAD